MTDTERRRMNHRVLRALAEADFLINRFKSAAKTGQPVTADDLETYKQWRNKPEVQDALNGPITVAGKTVEQELETLAVYVLVAWGSLVAAILTIAFLRMLLVLAMLP